MAQFDLDNNNMEFNSGVVLVKESNFKPKFYVIFIVVLSIYYFFSPILTQIILGVINNNFKISQLTLIWELVYKLFIPNFSIFIFLLIYILLIEERKFTFLFLGIKNNFLISLFKGLIISSVFLFLMIFVFIIQDQIIYFKFNSSFVFINIFQLMLVFIFTYIQVFFIECFYRGWLINIFSYRYSIYLSIVFTSILYTIVVFIDYRRIGLYLIYIFLFNIFLSLLYLIYKNIFIVISFHTFYTFLKQYVLSLESSSIGVNSLFYTAIDKNNMIYNIENNKYSLILLAFMTAFTFITYNYVKKRKL